MEINHLIPEEAIETIFSVRKSLVELPIIVCCKMASILTYALHDGKISPEDYLGLLIQQPLAFYRSEETIEVYYQVLNISGCNNIMETFCTFS